MIDRYKIPEVEAIWNKQAEIDRWTQIEVEICGVWHKLGKITEKQMKTIYLHTAVAPTPEEVALHEREKKHEIVAFLSSLRDRIPGPEKNLIHMGVTSSDILDTSLAIALRKSLIVVAEKLIELVEELHKLAKEHKDTVCAGRTHGVHAEPTTFGTVLLGYVSSLTTFYGKLFNLRKEISYGKISGAVGTYSQTTPELESLVLGKFGLCPEPVSTQVIPRWRHASVISTIALLGSEIARLCDNMRSLQRSEISELEEWFSQGQAGSSVMPHKKNPITLERLSGMSRLLRGYMQSAYENIGLWHERDMSHSSVERVILPDALHIITYMIVALTRIVSRIEVSKDTMRQNLTTSMSGLYSSKVLTALVEAGMDREQAYRLLQKASFRSKEQETSFVASLIQEDQIIEVLSVDTLHELCTYKPYLKHIDTIFERF